MRKIIGALSLAAVLMLAGAGMSSVLAQVGAGDTLPGLPCHGGGASLFFLTSAPVGLHVCEGGVWVLKMWPAVSPTVNDSPGRVMVTSTSATGYQISATQNAQVSYEGTFQTTSTIGGPASITVFLETAATNSTTPSDWTTIAQQLNSNTITLAIALNQVDTEPWSLSRVIPAGRFVRIRSGSVTGTATASLNTQQQEVTQ